MNVLIITGIYSPDVGGPATFTSNFTKYLDRNKIPNNIITLADDTKINSSHVVKIERNQLKILRILKVLMKLFSNGRASNILCTGLYEETGLYLFVKKVIFRIKTKKNIVRIVGDPIWERMRNSKKNNIDFETFNLMPLSIKFKIQRLFFVWAINQFDQVICPSTELTTLVKKWGIQIPVNYVPNGFPCIDPKSEKRIPINEFISVSRLVSWKNIDYIIDIVNKIKMNLTIIGDGPEMDFLRNYTCNSQNIVFTGKLELEQVNEQLKKSKFFISASSYEGMSFSVLNALSLGMTVILSDIKGNSEIIKNFRVIKIPLNNLDKAVNAILNNISNNNKMKKDSEYNKKVFQSKFCQEIVFDKYIRYLLKQ